MYFSGGILFDTSNFPIVSSPLTEEAARLNKIPQITHETVPLLTYDKNAGEGFSGVTAELPALPNSNANQEAPDNPPPERSLPAQEGQSETPPGASLTSDKKITVTAASSLQEIQTASSAVELAPEVEANQVLKDPIVNKIIEELRSKADAVIILSGGAAKISEESKARLLELFRALSIVGNKIRLVVGDGGTNEGIMMAAGKQRTNYELLGIAPKTNISFDHSLPFDSQNPPRDAEGNPLYEAEPNHTHYITIKNSPWLDEQKGYGWKPDWTQFGSETEAMYKVFGQISEGKPSVTIVANGGGITLDEVQRNIEQKRIMIVISGSGRAADIIAAIKNGLSDEEVLQRRVAGEETEKLLKKANKINVRENLELFTLFDLNKGPEALAIEIQAVLNKGLKESAGSPLEADLQAKIEKVLPGYRMNILDLGSGRIDIEIAVLSDYTGKEAFTVKKVIALDGDFQKFIERLKYDVGYLGIRDDGLIVDNSEYQMAGVTAKKSLRRFAEKLRTASSAITEIAKEFWNNGLANKLFKLAIFRGYRIDTPEREIMNSLIETIYKLGNSITPGTIYDILALINTESNLQQYAPTIGFEILRGIAIEKLKEKKRGSLRQEWLDEATLPTSFRTWVIRADITAMIELSRNTSDDELNRLISSLGQEQIKKEPPPSAVTEGPSAKQDDTTEQTPSVIKTLSRLKERIEKRRLIGYDLNVKNAGSGNIEVTITMPSGTLNGVVSLQDPVFNGFFERLGLYSITLKDDEKTNPYVSLAKVRITEELREFAKYLQTLSSSPLTLEVENKTGGIDLSQIDLTLKDEKYISNLNPADLKILRAAKALKDEWESLSLLYVHEIMLLLKDNLISELQNKHLLFQVLQQLQTKEFLDSQAIQFLNLIQSQRPLDEIKLALYQ